MSCAAKLENAAAWEAWTSALWPWLENDLRIPVTVQERKTHWRIEIMGALRVDLNRDHGGFRIFVRHQDCFVVNNRADLRLRSMLASSDWLHAWVWRRAHRCGLEVSTLPKVQAQVVEALRSRIADHDLYAARKAIRAALPLDPDILALALRANPLPCLGLGHYTAVARHRKTLEERERRAPSLLPVFAAWEELDDASYCDSCSDLEQDFRALGMSEGGWRALLRHGKALWRGLRRSHEFSRRPEQVLLEWANLVALLPQKDALPPDRIAQVWAQTRSMRDAPGDNDSHSQAQLVLAAWRRWDSLPTRAERRHWSREELLPVLSWAQAHSSESPCAPPNVGFAWYLRKQRAADTERTMRELDRKHPGQPDQTFEFENLRFIHLRSYASLYRAGLQFHNCLAQVPHSFNRVVSSGAHYAIGDATTGRALALLRADSDAEGRPLGVLEIRCACNQAAPGWLVRAAWRFARQNQSRVEALRAHSLLPEPRNAPSSVTA